MTACVFTVPGKPVGKGRPRFYRGRAITPENTRKYEALTAKLAKYAWKGNAPMHGAVKATICAHFAIPKSTSKKKRAAILQENRHYLHKCDCDNIAKIILDACNGIVYADDAQVAELHVVKRYAEDPRVEVVIEGICEEATGQ